MTWADWITKTTVVAFGVGALAGLVVAALLRSGQSQPEKWVPYDEWYGEHHQAEREKYVNVIREYGGVCMERECVMPSRRIATGAFWHLAHDHERGGRYDYLGPAHPECNEHEYEQRKGVGPQRKDEHEDNYLEPDGEDEDADDPWVSPAVLDDPSASPAPAHQEPSTGLDPFSDRSRDAYPPKTDWVPSPLQRHALGVRLADVLPSLQPEWQVDDHHVALEVVLWKTESLRLAWDRQGRSEDRSPANNSASQNIAFENADDVVNYILSELKAALASTRTLPDPEAERVYERLRAEGWV